MRKIAIGIDLGGTIIKGVLIDELGTVLAEDRKETHGQDAAYWKKSVAGMIDHLGKQTRQTVDIIGLSAPGLSDEQNSCIAFLPGRLSGLENFIWSDFIGQKVFVLNDAKAALMAEAAFGAAKGIQHAVLFTLGTGVGGGILINGQLYQGQYQMAGHVGHLCVDASSEETGITGTPGTLEEAIGNSSVNRRSHGIYSSTMELLDDHRKGDPFATWLWLSSVRKLSLAIASVCHVLSPEMVVLSGGITQANEDLMKPLRKFLALYQWRPGGKETVVVFARFADLAGAIGAAGFALTKIK